MEVQKVYNSLGLIADIVKEFEIRQLAKGKELNVFDFSKTVEELIERGADINEMMHLFGTRLEDFIGYLGD